MNFPSTQAVGLGSAGPPFQGGEITGNDQPTFRTLSGRTSQSTLYPGPI